jgi:hypothetical protein
MDGTSGTPVRLTLGQTAGRAVGLLIRALDQTAKRAAKAAATAAATAGGAAAGGATAGGGGVDDAREGRELAAVEEALAAAKMSAETVGASAVNDWLVGCSQSMHSTHPVQLTLSPRQVERSVSEAAHSLRHAGAPEGMLALLTGAAESWPAVVDKCRCVTMLLRPGLFFGRTR